MFSKKGQVIELEKGNENLMYRIKATNLPKDTMLVVPETHSAILIKDGRLMDTLNGGKYNLFDAKSEKKSESVSVEIIYLSKTVKLKANWGTKVKFKCTDAEFGLPLHVGARGTFEVQISNPRKAYISVIGEEAEVNLDKLRERLAERIIGKIEPVVAKAVVEKRISFDQISIYKEDLAEAVLEKLAPMLDDEYGLRIFSFNFEDVFVDEDDEQALRAERARRKEEKEREEKEERAKREEREKEEKAKQDEKEKDSFEWERMKYLLELRSSDYEKYLEVCKAIGWKPEPRVTGTNASGRFCRNCGTPYMAGDKFCPECGAPVGNSKKTCPKCGAEYPSTVNFCGKCGEKLVF